MRLKIKTVGIFTNKSSFPKCIKQKMKSLV